MGELTTEPRGDGVTELALAQPIDAVPFMELPSMEGAIVARARQGDVGAFEQIVELYEQRLLRFLVGQVGDVEVARELCQDTFLSAYKALPRIRGELKLSGWLHTIAINKARSHHRKRKFRVFVSIEDQELPARGFDMQEQLANQEMVVRVLNQLPKKYSEPLLMQLGSGMTCLEIATVLKCSEGAVKVRLMRAREAFKVKYRDEMAR